MLPVTPVGHRPGPRRRGGGGKLGTRRLPTDPAPTGRRPCRDTAIGANHVGQPSVRCPGAGRLRRGPLAVLSNRLSQRIFVPAPLLVLVAAAVTENVLPSVHVPSERLVERMVTIALICILFDGGMHMGWARFRTAAVPITVLGVVATFLTVAGVALLVHLAVGLGWFPSLLVATAVSPTDPAIVFAVLGQREIEGRSGTILEGSRSQRPRRDRAAGQPRRGGRGGCRRPGSRRRWLRPADGRRRAGRAGRRPATLWFMRPSSCRGGALPAAHGGVRVDHLRRGDAGSRSGFLAVFVAGILLGDERAPYKREIERFHSALASLGEIVAFTMLGLTVNRRRVARADVWLPGCPGGRGPGRGDPPAGGRARAWCRSG